MLLIVFLEVTYPLLYIKKEISHGTLLVWSSRFWNKADQRSLYASRAIDGIRWPFAFDFLLVAVRTLLESVDTLRMIRTLTAFRSRTSAMMTHPAGFKPEGKSFLTGRRTMNVVNRTGAPNGLEKTKALSLTVLSFDYLT